MNEFILKVFDFITEYYHVFIVFIALVLFIRSLFTKSQKNDFVRVFKAVCEAEEKFPDHGTGAVKLAYVIKQLSDLPTEYVINTVDDVLSSPEKK